MPQIGAVSATLSDIGSATVISPSAASSVTPYAVAQIFTPARLLRGNPLSARMVSASGVGTRACAAKPTG
jgi:hypothetical protein